MKDRSESNVKETTRVIDGPWMTSKEAAEYLRMSVGALRVAVCKGDIRPYRWRRRLYFKRFELDRMIEAGRMTTVPRY